MMGGSLVVLDYAPNTYDLQPVLPRPCRRQRAARPDPRPAQTSEVFIFFAGPRCGYDLSTGRKCALPCLRLIPGCVQRIDFTTGKVSWQTVSPGSFSFSPYGFNKLMTDSDLFFSNGNQLFSVDKSTGTVRTVLENEDYEVRPPGIVR